MKGRRSKLQLHIATLETLAVNGPMNMTRMMLKVKVNSSSLKRILADLTEKDLVEQNTLRRKTVYTATPRARTILSHLKEFSRIFPITEIAPTSCHIDQCRAISQQEQPPV